MSEKFSHLDEQGNAKMVNVGEKKVTSRLAKAQGIIETPLEVFKALQATDFNSKKGPILQIATIAGIMGAKKTSELIPLCHPIGMDDCDIQLQLRPPNKILIECTAQIKAKTGVEMEALTGVTVAALTIYDMCKALSHDIKIKEIQLMEKTGGKRDFKRS